MFVETDNLGANVVTLLRDPLVVVVREDRQSLDEPWSVHGCEFLHVETALLDHVADRRAVLGTITRRFRHGHLVLRHHDGTHFDGTLGLTVGSLGVNRDAMTDREFHLVAVDHFERFALLVVRIRVSRDLPAEHVPGGTSLRAPNNQLWLENPGSVLIFVGLFLTVHEEQRHQSVAVGIPAAYSSLYADCRLFGIRSSVSDWPFSQIDRDLSATGHTLPDFRLRALLFFEGVGVCPGLVDFGLVIALIASPPRLDVDRVDVPVDTEGYPETRRNERLVAGCVDLVERLGFGVDTACCTVELSAGLVPAVVHVEVARIGVLGFGRKRPVETLNTAVVRTRGCELTNEITVAHARIDDAFVLPVGRAEQVVHDGQL